MGQAQEWLEFSYSLVRTPKQKEQKGRSCACGQSDGQEPAKRCFKNDYPICTVLIVKDTAGIEAPIQRGHCRCDDDAERNANCDCQRRLLLSQRKFHA